MTTEHLPLAAIAVHGCHVGAEDWAKLVWGDPTTGKRGRMAQALHLATLWRDRVRCQLILGTGASKLADGTLEAQAILNVALANFERGARVFNYDVDLARQLLADIRLNLDTQNTTEEVAAIIRICQELGIREVYLLTSPFHAPRCLADALKASKTEGFQFFGLASETDSADGIAGTVIAEAPHRGDDWMLGVPRNRRRGDLMRRMFRIGKEPWGKFASALDALLRRYDA